MLLSVRDVTLRFGGIVALDGVSFEVERGVVSGLIGPNGAGKTTVFNVITRLYTPDSGEVDLDGTTLLRTPPHGIVRRGVARTFQNINLFRTMSVLENVLVGGHSRGRAVGEREALEALDVVGLADRAKHTPAMLSGGEQQRVAIAVALANEPEVLFADEPTGELDTTTSSEIFGLLRRVNEELGTTIVIVTHDALVSEQVQRTVAIRDGRTSTETVRRSSVSETGEHELISEEFAVLDRAGRLQLPKAHVAALGLKDRVRLRLEDDHVEIWPDTGSLLHPTEPIRPEADR
jgi:ABC-type branched-subunit amino acid transport system ATPase component